MWAQADCTEMKSQQEAGTSGFEVAQPAGAAAARPWTVLRRHGTGKATEWVQIAGSHKWVANESILGRPFQLSLLLICGGSKLTRVL